jgi:hypothetical protein
LFIANDIYEYWVAYEQASLCRHVFPMERGFCLEKARQFLDNPLAPDHLRGYIESEVVALEEKTLT